MPVVHLIEGPVGAGKSTFAASLATRIEGVHIALDEWFAHLFSADRPRARLEGFELAIYVVDAPRDIRRERVRRRNAEKGPTFSMVVPDHIFEIASDLWEPPDEFERSESAIEDVTATSLQISGVNA